MTIKNLKVAICVAFMGIFLVACGVTKEQIDEATQAVQTMKEARENAETLFLDITDSSRKNELDILAKEAEKLEATEIDKLGSKKMEEFVSEVTEVTLSYQSMGRQFSEILKTETIDREEREKHTYYNLYITNKTGKTLSRIVIRDETAAQSSDNVLGDGVMLPDGYTLMGSMVDIHADSTDWTIIIEDEAENESFISCESLKGINLEGKTIVLGVDSDNGALTAKIGK